MDPEFDALVRECWHEGQTQDSFAMINIINKLMALKEVVKKWNRWKKPHMKKELNDISAAL